MAQPSQPTTLNALFPEATLEEWNDWRWQMRHSIRSYEALTRVIDLTEDEHAGCRETRGIFRLGISPYYLSLIDRDHPSCPIRMQSIPLKAESTVQEGELLDPLGEDPHRPVSAIIHKYPDRVVLLALDSCSVYCRHCTRRRITKGGEADLAKDELKKALDYIRAHAQIRDVIVSGGDPLLLSDGRLEELLSSLQSIPHVEMIRIGTRIPVCLPMRVTESLCQTIRRYAPVYVVTHFNHPKEVTAEARRACELLVDHGVPVENQAVLMRRINSSAALIKDLSHACLKMRVRPYYLHQMDLAQGLEHLRTPLNKGIEIMEALRGHTSGMAVPHFAVDLPAGGGKVTVQPNYLLEKNSRRSVFRNYQGKPYIYPEPIEQDCECPYEPVWRSQQVKAVIQPSDSQLDRISKAS